MVLRMPGYHSCLLAYTTWKGWELYRIYNALAIRIKPSIKTAVARYVTYAYFLSGASARAAEPAPTAIMESLQKGGAGCTTPEQVFVLCL